jgi:hypothetical protein
MMKTHEKRTNTDKSKLTGTITPGASKSAPNPADVTALMPLLDLIAEIIAHDITARDKELLVK